LTGTEKREKKESKNGKPFPFRAANPEGEKEKKKERISLLSRDLGRGGRKEEEGK